MGADNGLLWLKSKIHDSSSNMVDSDNSKSSCSKQNEIHDKIIPLKA
jgi:hypothetical protein